MCPVSDSLRLWRRFRFRLRGLQITSSRTALVAVTKNPKGLQLMLGAFLLPGSPGEEAINGVCLLTCQLRPKMVRRFLWKFVRKVVAVLDASNAAIRQTAMIGESRTLTSRNPRIRRRPEKDSLADGSRCEEHFDIDESQREPPQPGWVGT